MSLNETGEEATSQAESARGAFRRLRITGGLGIYAKLHSELAAGEIFEARIGATAVFRQAGVWLNWHDCSPDPALRFIGNFGPHLNKHSPHFVADPHPARGPLFIIGRVPLRGGRGF